MKKMMKNSHFGEIYEQILLKIVDKKEDLHFSPAKSCYAFNCSLVL